MHTFKPGDVAHVRTGTYKGQDVMVESLAPEPDVYRCRLINTELVVLGGEWMVPATLEDEPQPKDNP